MVCCGSTTQSRWPTDDEVFVGVAVGDWDTLRVATGVSDGVSGNDMVSVTDVVFVTVRLSDGLNVTDGVDDRDAESDVVCELVTVCVRVIVTETLNVFVAV